MNNGLLVYIYTTVYITFTFSHLADVFIQSDLQMRTKEAIKINKRAITCKCYNMSQLACIIYMNFNLNTYTVIIYLYYILL